MIVSQEKLSSSSTKNANRFPPTDKIAMRKLFSEEVEEQKKYWMTPLSSTYYYA